MRGMFINTISGSVRPAREVYVVACVYGKVRISRHTVYYNLLIWMRMIYKTEEGTSVMMLSQLLAFMYMHVNSPWGDVCVVSKISLQKDHSIVGLHPAQVDRACPLNQLRCLGRCGYFIAAITGGKQRFSIHGHMYCLINKLVVLLIEIEWVICEPSMPPLFQKMACRRQAFIWTNANLSIIGLWAMLWYFIKM